MRIARLCGTRPSTLALLVAVAVLLLFATEVPSRAAAGTPGTESDLDAFLIERTPKLDYDASPNMPTAGEKITFYAHVRYWGDETSPALKSVPYEWRIDGEVVLEGTIDDFEPLRTTEFDYTGYPDPADRSALSNPQNWPKNPAAFPESPPDGWRVVSLPWTWEAGRHTVEFRIDPSDSIVEKVEANNHRSDFTDALSLSAWVEESTWRYFHEFQHELGGLANSWEDWIQRQMARLNELNADASSPDDLNGVLDRVRVDRIIVVPDGILPINGGVATNNPDLLDKTVDLQWGFPAYDPNTSTFYSDHTTISDANPFWVEQSLIHELGHARYLIDSYGFDVHNTAHHGGTDSVQIFEGTTYVGGSEYMPYLAFDEVLHYNLNGGVMTGPYGFNWSPYEIGALNRIAGQRARCGNMNAPCNIGEYLQDLPLCNHLLLVDSEETPIRNADVRVYEAEGGPGFYGKTFDNTPDQSYTSDEDGYVHLPQNPFNPDGPIEHTFGIANGIIILRVQSGDDVWYRFLEVAEFNMEYWRGHTDDGFYTLWLDSQPGRAATTAASTAPKIDCASSGLSGDTDCDDDVDSVDVALGAAPCLGPRNLRGVYRGGECRLRR